MQSVEAEDLFETNIHPLPVIFPNTRALSLHLPCRIPFLPRWSLASHLVSLLIHTCYDSRLHSELGS